MATNVPESLKIIQPFLKLAKEYESRDVVVSYWSRYHAVQLGIKHKTKDNISFLMNLMDVLEKTKQSQSEIEAITNEIVAQAHLESKGMQLFLWADTEDRASRSNKNVVKSFYSASLIFDILAVFGELNDEILSQRKYGKWKAAYINNCIKKGEVPVPGPIGGDNDEQSENIGPGTSGLPYPTQPPSSIPSGQPPSNMYPPGNTMVTPAPVQYPYQPPSNMLPPGNTMVTPSPVQYPYQPQQQHPPVSANQPPSSSTSSGVQLEPTDFTTAQKYCKYAASALQYEDVPTAIDNLQKALKLLQTGKR